MVPRLDRGKKQNFCSRRPLDPSCSGEGGGVAAHIPAITASATEEVASIPTLKSSGTNPVEKKTSP